MYMKQHQTITNVNKKIKGMETTKENRNFIVIKRHGKMIYLIQRHIIKLSISNNVHVDFVVVLFIFTFVFLFYNQDDDDATEAGEHGGEEWMQVSLLSFQTMKAN